MTVETKDAPPHISPLRPLAAAVGGGLLIGAATSYGQGLLPHVLAPLANSAGSWSLLAFLLGMLGRRPWVGALVGVLSLAAMVLGYDLASLLRGHQASAGMTAFWLLAAVTAGPFLGWSGDAVRGRTPAAPAAVGVMGGVLVGEGAYGLLYLAETTSSAYWGGSVLAGAALLLWAGVRRNPDMRSVLVSVGTAALLAAAFVLVYAKDLLMLFADAGQAVGAPG